VGDAGPVHFPGCKDLTQLILPGTNVSDVGLAHFKYCKNLTILSLDRTQVTDVGLAHFKGMPLTKLRIDNTGITDSAARHVAGGHPSDPEENYQGPGYLPRDEECPSGNPA
jgi:hypothetical protein